MVDGRFIYVNWFYMITRRFAFQSFFIRACCLKFTSYLNAFNRNSLYIYTLVCFIVHTAFNSISTDVASATMDEFDLELDEMELVAAAAGYYYYNSVSKQPQHSISTSGSGFMTRVLEGHDNVCRQMFRMDKHVFSKLCGTLRQRGMLRDTAGVMIEEQLAIFLNIVGHNERNRVIQERFQHSGETISRHFNNVLKAIKSLSREFLLPPPPNTPPEIINSNRFYPYFKVCI